MDNSQNKRTVFLLASALDTVLSGIVLLIYFGLLPIDISGWGIPRWVIGLVGGVWFVISIAILAYQLTRTDVSE
jgi:hypothetical protein